MKTHKFTLVLAGVAKLTPEIANTLYEAMHGDIELQMCNGIATLDVARPAKTLHSAITSAIRDVEQADLGIRVLRVGSEAASTIACINAELLTVSSER